MSIPNRLWNISKAYLNQVRDQIDDALAEKELDMSANEAGKPDRDDASPAAMMQRAQARIDAARRDLEASQGRTSTDASAPSVSEERITPRREPSTPVQDADPNNRHYKVLGVPTGSDLSVVQAAYENLIRRCDPKRFDDGSDEQKTAEQILVKINNSYDALRKHLDPTENRFAKLELE